MQVAATGIFLMQMRKSPLPMTFLVQFRIMGHTILYGPADNGLRDYQAVRFGNQPAVDASRGGLGGCPVVFGRLGDSLDLVRREPFPEPCVFPDDASAFQMVCLAVHGKPEVMEGGGSEQNILVNVVVPPHFHGTCDYGAGVILPVSLVEGRIAWDDFPLDVFQQRRVHIHKQIYTNAR